MRIAGIIMEANPFHNGHLYLIKQIQAQINPDIIIAICTTSFNMRGEISVTDKFTKVKDLLNAGCDLVFEYPLALSLASADYFAKRAINILSKLGITDLAFGVEDDNLDRINEVVNIINTTEFNTIFKANLTLRLSYKKTFNKTLADLGFTDDIISIVTQPNLTLAIQYLRYMKDTNILPILIKRYGNDYYDLTSNNNIASATTIRQLLLNNELSKLKTLIPYNDELIDLNLAENNLCLLSAYHFKTKKLIPTEDGIENYIIKNGDFTLNYTNLINSLKNKHYSSSRLRRYILSSLLDIKDIDKLNQDYLRLLGLNNKGETYISTLNKDIKKNIFTSIQEIYPNNNKNNNLNPDIELNSISVKQLVDYELKASLLFDILTKQKTTPNEYKLPIRKESL